MQQTTDGGYVLGGYSSSEIGGDKTVANWDTTNYFYDYWIVKIDSNGIKQWDKRYGGVNGDWFDFLRQMKDNGYLLSGWSYSGVDGDKTQDTCGLSDGWIVKTDSVGNIQWDKDYRLNIFSDEL